MFFYKFNKLKERFFNELKKRQERNKQNKLRVFLNDDRVYRIFREEIKKREKSEEMNMTMVEVIEVL
jgi:hypothetical protein